MQRAALLAAGPRITRFLRFAVNLCICKGASNFTPDFVLIELDQEFLLEFSRLLRRWLAIVNAKQLDSCNVDPLRHLKIDAKFSIDTVQTPREIDEIAIPSFENASIRFTNANANSSFVHQSTLFQHPFSMSYSLADFTSRLL